MGRSNELCASSVDRTQALNGGYIKDADYTVPTTNTG